MPILNFHLLRDLSPPAFKLYAYFLDQVQSQHTTCFTLPMVDLGQESGLQPPCLYPAFRHGKDRQLRNAIDELIQTGRLKKTGQRGRAPNTYTVLRSHLHADPHTQRRLL